MRAVSLVLTLIEFDGKAQPKFFLPSVSGFCSIGTYAIRPRERVVLLTSLPLLGLQVQRSEFLAGGRGWRCRHRVRCRSQGRPRRLVAGRGYRERAASR